MPVNNFQQARIDMSRAQAKAVAELLKDTRSAGVALEETNIQGCIAVLMPGVTLVHHGGEVHKIGASTIRAAAARPQGAKKKVR